MTQPALVGAALIDQLAATTPGDDRLAAWWLGQCGWLFRSSSLTVCLDPYLSEAPVSGVEPALPRAWPPLFAPSELTTCDLIVITHRHEDHLDPVGLPALLAASPQALLVLPAALADYAADELGVADERMIPIREGEMYQQEDLRLHAVPAAHERLEQDLEGRFSTLGYLLHWPMVTIYAAGDTVPYATQVEKVKSFAPQVALLPINGRDATRREQGIVGNLTIVEAALLAHQLGVAAVAPCHWGLFEGDTADIDAFEAFVTTHYPPLKALVTRPGERCYLPAS